MGLLLIPALVGAILAVRPGGLRRQLRMIARRLRIMITLVGVFLIGSALLRLIFTSGPISDYGQPAMAVVLAGAFLLLAQDPSPDPEQR